MAITNGYITLNDFKERIDITDTLDDEEIEALITTASRVIDNITNRRFYPVAETRYFTAEDPDYLRVFDLLGVSALKTDEDGDRTYEVTWQTTDYDLMPFNASLDSRPYTWLETTPDGDYAFPKIKKGVQIAGTWGYSTTAPVPIAEACILATNRLMKRHDTPLGVSAGVLLGEMQTIVRQLQSDPDFMGLIESYIKRW